MKFFDLGLRRHDLLDNMGAEDRVFKNDFRLNLWWRLYEIIGDPYMRWGTMYQLDMDKLKEDLDNINMSGDGWNDYDSDGIPYWEKYDLDWDFEDEVTGDAFRIIRK